MVYVRCWNNFMQKVFPFSSNKAHMCNILAKFSDILEIKITDEDSD